MVQKLHCRWHCYSIETTTKIIVFHLQAETVTESAMFIHNHCGLTISILYLSQISFDSTSASLDDRSRFKSLFRTIPSLDNYAPAILKLLQIFKWKKLAVFTQKELFFEKVIKNNNLHNGMSCCDCTHTHSWKYCMLTCY